MAITAYEILGVPQIADAEQIRAAYRKIAKKDHPDRSQNDAEAIVRFQQATEAYQTLIDPVKRLAYDRKFEPVRSIGQLFREHEAGQRASSSALPAAPAEPKRGADACVVLSRSRLAKARGGILQVTIRGDVVQSQVPLEVPSDIRDLRVCTLPHLGSPGRNDGENGDLLLLFIDENEGEK